MFNTIQECVLDWNNSYIASNTMTKNINDLLEYYGKLEQQDAERKQKTCCQDNSKFRAVRSHTEQLFCHHLESYFGK
jgi:hypothetical protein